MRLLDSANLLMMIKGEHRGTGAGARPKRFAVTQRKRKPYKQEGN